MIILLFGQPASGKTTLADIIAKGWENRKLFTIRIDGDKWREITKNKDYSKEGRIRNLKGAFDMALYLEQEGFTVILSFVTPYKELRDYLKSNANELFQIFLEYKGGRGRDDKFAEDFEIPSPEECLLLNTSELSIDQSLETISDYLSK